MKKLTKSNLDTMAQMLPELNEDEQRGIIGGTGSCSDSSGATTTGFVYTKDQMNFFLNVGCWSGGDVEGIGYVQAYTGSAFVHLTGSVFTETVYQAVEIAGAVNECFESAGLDGLPGFNKFSNAVSVVKSTWEAIEKGQDFSLSDAAKLAGELYLTALSCNPIALTVEVDKMFYDKIVEPTIKKGIDYSTKLEKSMSVDGSFSFYAPRFGF